MGECCYQWNQHFIRCSSYKAFLLMVNAPTAGRIYPNPFTNGFNIALYNSSATNRIATAIFDIGGRLIRRRDFGNVAPGNNTRRINETAAMKPGVYIAMVKVSGRTVQSGKQVETRELNETGDERRETGKIIVSRQPSPDR
jgi:hypothetical protein